MILEPTSVFPVVTFDAKDEWRTVVELTGRSLDARGVKRLQGVLGAKCACVVVEREYIDKDYRDTFSNFHSKKFATPSSRCTRLHFFTTSVSPSRIASLDAVDAAAVQKAYLGYSVIRPTVPNCIGRTLLTHSLRTDPSAHLTMCVERVHLLGAELTVEGFPFISQDYDATVCAESALWMLLRYYSTRYRCYSEILPFQITSLAAHHAAGKRVYPSGGLYSWQLAEALRLQRFSPMVYSRNQYSEFNFDHLLYTYIESGLPLLVTVPKHVVVAFGHASDYSSRPPSSVVRWLKSVTGKSKFIYSSHFNRAYVVNDDNFFPYQMLHEDGRDNGRDSPYKWSEIQEFIVPLPEKVFLPAEKAQIAIESLLLDDTVGIAKHAPTLGEKALLFRLFLASSKSFKRRLTERKMGEVGEIYRRLPMPHFLWICEIAEYDEYARSKTVVGEVLWDATRNAKEADGWIALHYPGKLILDVGAASNGPHQRRTLLLPVSNSYSLFRSNLHSLPGSITQPSV